MQMQRWQYPINNGTIETLYLINNVKDIALYVGLKCLILIFP